MPTASRLPFTLASCCRKTATLNGAGITPPALTTRTIRCSQGWAKRCSPKERSTRHSSTSSLWLNGGRRKSPSTGCSCRHFMLEVGVGTRLRSTTTCATHSVTSSPPCPTPKPERCTAPCCLVWHLLHPAVTTCPHGERALWVGVAS